MGFDWTHMLWFAVFAETFCWMFRLILAVGSCWHTRVCRHPDSLIDGRAAVPVSAVVEDSNEMSVSETHQTQHELA